MSTYKLERWRHATHVGFEPKQSLLLAKRAIVLAHLPCVVMNTIHRGVLKVEG